MGNLVTKITTNSIELNESNVSDIVVFEQVKKDSKEKDKKSPNTLAAQTGLFKNVFMGADPRSPSTFITRTPIQLFRSGSKSKFNHQELLNESLNESIDLDILTVEEQKSLDSNKDLVDAVNKEEAEEAVDSENDIKENLPDPRSPTIEIVRTPILISEENRKTEDKLMKKITDKLVAAKISNDNDDGRKKNNENLKKRLKSTEKNLIYEDEFEDFDRFSTPPKKANGQQKDRTPLSCLANKARNSQFQDLLTSTPKGSKIPIFENRLHNRLKNKPI